MYILRRVVTHSVPPTRKLQIFKAVLEEGLDPGDFDWQEVVSEVTKLEAGSSPFTVEKFWHDPTEYFFLFDTKGHRTKEEHWLRPWPDPEGLSNWVSSASWDGAFDYLRQWLRTVHAEYTAPNPWTDPQAPLALNRWLVSRTERKRPSNTRNASIRWAKKISRRSSRNFFAPSPRTETGQGGASVKPSSTSSSPKSSNTVSRSSRSSK
jgi:hypothetical protein